MSNLPTKYKGKYRIASNRLKGWDYHAPGYYFVTICTQDKVPWFGNIFEEKLQLSQIGDTAVRNLERIPQIYPTIYLDAWTLMPNHGNALIVLRDQKVETLNWGASTKAPNWRQRTLGVVVNQYKATCTKKIRMEGCTNFDWRAGAQPVGTDVKSLPYSYHKKLRMKNGKRYCNENAHLGTL